MKTIPLTAFLILLTLNAFSQFTGEVVYREAYEIKIPGISSADFQKHAGDTRHLYIQNGFYKNENNSPSFNQWIYRGDENRIYFIEKNSDTIKWYDASVRKYEKTSFTQVEKTDEVILGKKCKKLTLKSNVSTVTYYFSNDYPLDSKVYARHFFESWNLYTSLAEAIPLKVVLETKEMKATSTAIRIEPKIIPKSVFEVPKRVLKKLD